MSVKKTERKFKRGLNGNLEPVMCPLCKKEEETIHHYNNECIIVKQFRREIANITKLREITDETWNLNNSSTSTLNDIIIAKA